MATRLIPPISLSYIELFVDVHVLENYVFFIFSANNTILLGIQQNDSIILISFHSENSLEPGIECRHQLTLSFENGSSP